MSSPPRFNSPETRWRANARLRRVTRAAALLATGATIAIGVVVAKEHPGASASSGAVPAQNPSESSTSVPTTSPRTTTGPPSATRSGPVVTSGGTAR